MVLTEQSNERQKHLHFRDATFDTIGPKFSLQVIDKYMVFKDTYPKMLKKLRFLWQLR